MQETEIKEVEIEEVVYYNVGDLLGVGMSLVVLGIGLAYGLNVIADVEADFTTGSYEANATLETKAAIYKIAAKLGLIVTVILAAVIIGILVRYLFVRFT